MMSLTWSRPAPGSAVSRSTPNGLSVSARTLAISSTISSGAIVDAPERPKPPASLTRRRRGGGRTPRPCRRASPGARSRGCRSVGCACRRSRYRPVTRAGQRRGVRARAGRNRRCQRRGVTATARGSSSNSQRAKLRRVHGVAPATRTAPRAPLAGAGPGRGAPTCGGRRRARAATARSYAARAELRGRRRRRRRLLPASRPVSSACPMPSPVIGSVTAAASPTNSTRPRGEGGGSTRAVSATPCADSRAGVRAECAATCGRRQQLGHSAPSCARRGASGGRKMPKPTLAVPPPSGNDQA